MDEDIWDGDWVLFSMDTSTGIETWYNPKEDLIRKITHADRIVNNNKIARQNNAGTRWGDGKIVASVPLDVLHSKLQGAIEQGDQKYLKRFLNDSDNAAWKRREGTI